MKKILLSSAAIVAFAGAASADVAFSGSAVLGYNSEVESGIYADLDLDVTMSQELDNGWTATVTYGFELEQFSEDEDEDFTSDDNLTLSLTNGTYGLTFGNTEYAASEYWSGVSEMDEDGFSEVDGEDNIKVSATFDNIEGAVSTGVDTDTGDTFQTSFGVAGTFDAISFSLAYQEEEYGESDDADDNDDFTNEEIFAVAVGASFGGADVTLAYAKSEGEDSTGLEVSYPVGDITLGAFYVFESADEDNYGVSAVYAAGVIEAKAYYKSLNDSDEFGIGGSYTMDNLVVTVGYVDGDSTSDDDFGAYIIADYDLGGGASILASYADGIEGGVDSDDIDTVVGGYELYDGATVELSLDF